MIPQMEEFPMEHRYSLTWDVSPARRKARSGQQTVKVYRVVAVDEDVDFFVADFEYLDLAEQVVRQHNDGLETWAMARVAAGLADAKAEWAEAHGLGATMWPKAPKARKAAWSEIRDDYRVRRYRAELHDEMTALEAIRTISRRSKVEAA